MRGLKRDNVGAHFLERSQVLGLLGGNLGLIHAPVLVPALVLRIQDVLGVVLPGKIADATLAVMGNDPIIVVAQRAHPNVQHTLVRGKIAEPGAVG